MFFKNRKEKRIYKKAFNSVSEGNYVKAIGYFLEVYDDYSNEPNFIYGLAYSYFMIKDWCNSLKYLNEFIELNPDNENVINTKAACLVHLNRFEDALNCLDEFLSTHKVSPELLKNKKEIEMLNNISSHGKIQLNIK